MAVARWCRVLVSLAASGRLLALRAASAAVLARAVWRAGPPGTAPAPLGSLWPLPASPKPAASLAPLAGQPGSATASQDASIAGPAAAASTAAGTQAAQARATGRPVTVAALPRMPRRYRGWCMSGAFVTAAIPAGIVVCCREVEDSWLV